MSFLEAIVWEQFCGFRKELQADRRVKNTNKKGIEFMKRMKKIASIVLAMVMVLAMSIPVMAADNHPHNITVTQNTDDKTEHTYEAYQIFAGDLAEIDGAEGKKEKVLSNIIWGSGVNGDDLLAALKGDEELGNYFAECKNASDVAKVLAGDAFESSTVANATLTDTFAGIVEDNLSTTIAGTVKGAGNVTIPVTGSGYYLVKDQDNSVNTTNGAYSRFMLEVVGDVTANVKSEVPHGDKEVYTEGTDGTLVQGEGNYASIGSHVSYVITSEVPNHVGYNYYFFIMNDTLSKGLTFDGASTVTVTVGGRELRQNGENPEYYVYTDNVGDYTFRLAFANIKDFTVGDEIVVTYSATVNDEAEIGSTGNPNEWTLKYSNNPNETYEMDTTRPGLPIDEENTVLGETPKELTLTYVTELDITKYANEAGIAENLLAGAEFTLTGTSRQVVLKNVEYYEASDDGTYYLLTDGTYTETEPTGTEYVEIGVGTADTTRGYIKVGDNYVVPEDVKDYEGETLYKLVKGTAEKYADVNTKYEKKTDTTTGYKDADVSIELTTGDDGKISFKGLGAGTYTLTETVTPEGFNTLDPITITVDWSLDPNKVNDGTEKCTWTMSAGDDLTITDNGAGIFAADVINKSGSLLPSTGGIGTTIFYVVGGILVVGAAVLLVTKKRMSKTE